MRSDFSLKQKKLEHQRQNGIASDTLFTAHGHCIPIIVWVWEKRGARKLVHSYIQEKSAPATGTILRAKGPVPVASRQ